MGGSSSKKGSKSSPKPMPYKRPFSSDQAREQQDAMYSDYKSKKDLSEQKDNDVKIRRASILDPTKYRPPPSPKASDVAAHAADQNKDSAIPSVKETDEDMKMHEEHMTDEEALQIKQNTERGLSPGINLLLGASALEDADGDADDAAETVEDVNDVLIKQTSNHQRLASEKQSALVWGYCEMSRKRLDEDQAAFLTWTHPTDGFVTAYAVFDGHGGYETALYSAEHFLRYVEKHHLTRSDLMQNDLTAWHSLLKQIFVKFDAHVGDLGIRGGSTVVCVLFIGTYVITANAGDARAIMSSSDGKAEALSFDHSPMDDYDRLVKLARQPDTYKKISKFFRLNRPDESYADVQKLSQIEIRKAPFITREQDKSRLLGTIGVSRGFGDFTLSVFGFKSIALKPFLSAEPFVSIRKLNPEDIKHTDIMCVACDGVFDVMSNQVVCDILRKQIFHRQHDDTSNEEEKPDAKAKTPVYSKEAKLKVDCAQIDKACSFLGIKAYQRGTQDDVTIFAVPLKQVFECL